MALPLCFFREYLPCGFKRGYDSTFDNTVTFKGIPAVTSTWVFVSSSAFNGTPTCNGHSAFKGPYAFAGTSTIKGICAFNGACFWPYPP